MNIPVTPDPDTRTGLCLKLGGLLFSGGASTQRIIDSVSELYYYLGGASDLTVTVSYDAVMVSESRGEERTERSKRFPATFTANVRSLMEISSYLHSLERTHPTTSGISEFLDKVAIGPQVYPVTFQFLAAGVLGACYCAINNGDLWAMVASFVCTMVIFGFRRTFIHAGMNFYASTLLALLAGVTLAVFFSRVDLVTAKSVAIAAPTLFLIPAVPMVLGGMDILRNHNGIGVARWACLFMMMMTIFLGLAIVVGLTQPVLETTEISARPWPLFLLVVILACAIGSAMLGILFNSPVKYLPLFLLCGATTWGVRALAMHLGWSPEGGTFLGAVTSTLLAIFISRKTHVDCVILAMLSVIPMVPGYMAIRGIRGIFAITNQGGEISLSGVSETTHFIFTATLIFLAIILGPVFTLLIADRKSARI